MTSAHHCLIRTCRYSAVGETFPIIPRIKAHFFVLQGMQESRSGKYNWLIRLFTHGFEDFVTCVCSRQCVCVCLHKDGMLSKLPAFSAFFSVTKNRSNFSNGRAKRQNSPVAASGLWYQREYLNCFFACHVHFWNRERADKYTCC